MESKVELCASSYRDAYYAAKLGADRIELNSALYLGGLTPSVGTFNQIVKDFPNLEVVCMIRTRGGGFVYSEEEYEGMYEDAKYFLEHGASGISFGFLNEDHSIDVTRTKAFVLLAHSFNKQAVFHRAIDLTYNYKASIEQLYQLHIDRVLTSGSKKTAIEGKQIISELTKYYEGKMEILAGCGIKSNNVSELLDLNINQIHGSCSCSLEDHTSYTNEISFDYMGKGIYEGVDETHLEKLISIVKKH